MKKLKLMIAAGCCAAGLTAAAQVNQFGQPTQLTVTTNSSVLSATPFSYYVPPISLTIYATNALTIITNTINSTIQLGSTNFVIANTFIYTAATMGTNFSTNWSGYYAVGTNYVYGQASPQGGGTNIVYIK